MRKILVVDDEITIVRALQRALSGHFEVIGSIDPLEAITLADVFAPDVVIADHWMPEMCGDRVLSEVKRRRPSTAGVLLSGDPMLELRVIKGPAVDRFVPKPWDADVLIEDLTSLETPSKRAR